MDIRISFPVKRIIETLDSLFPESLDPENLKVVFSFDYPNYKYFHDYILEWDSRKKIVEPLFTEYDPESNVIDVHLHTIVVVADIMHHSYMRIVKFIVYYGIGTWLFREKLGREHNHNQVVERFVSTMIAYHCIRHETNRILNIIDDGPDYEENDPEMLLAFFYDILDLLVDDYQRCKCFIKSKEGKNDALPLEEILRLIEEIGNGTMINSSEELMRFFDDYIDQRFLSCQETVTAYLPYLEQEQKNRWGHLDHDHGFYPD